MTVAVDVRNLSSDNNRIANWQFKEQQVVDCGPEYYMPNIQYFCFQLLPHTIFVQYTSYNGVPFI